LALLAEREKLEERYNRRYRILEEEKRMTELEAGTRAAGDDPVVEIGRIAEDGRVAEAEAGAEAEAEVETATADTDYSGSSAWESDISPGDPATAERRIPHGKVAPPHVDPVEDFDLSGHERGKSYMRWSAYQRIDRRKAAGEAHL
jgi:hypothetical protein